MAQERVEIDIDLNGNSGGRYKETIPFFSKFIEN